MENEQQPPSVSSLEGLCREYGYEISFTVGYNGKCRLALKKSAPYHSGPKMFYADSGEDTSETRYYTALTIGVTRMLDYEHRMTPTKRPALNAGDQI